MAWLSNFTYRKEITLNNTGGTLTDFQLAFTINRDTGSDSGFTVYVGSKCEADYDDIRFTASDGTTLLDLAIESYDSGTALVWVTVPTIEGSGNTTIYLYYGKADATAVSDADAVFLKADEFPGSSLDTGKWTAYAGSGSVTVSDGKLLISLTATGPTPVISSILSNDTFSIPLKVIVKYAAQRGATSTPTLHIPFWFNSGSHLRAYQGNAWYTDYGLSIGSSNYQKGTSLISVGDNTSTSEVYHRDIYQLITGDLKAWSDGAYKGVSATAVTGANSQLRIAVYAWDAGTQSKLYIDHIYLAKAASVEPTVSAWGAETIDLVPKTVTGKYSILTTPKTVTGKYSILTTPKTVTGKYGILISQNIIGKYKIITAIKNLIGKYSVFQSKEITGRSSILQSKEITGRSSILQSKNLIGKYPIAAGSPMIGRYRITAAVPTLTGKYDIMEYIRFDDRVKVPFVNGSSALQIRETLTGHTSGASGTVAVYYLTGGSFGDGDAAGYVYVLDPVGIFTSGEDLDGSLSGDGAAEVTGAPARDTVKTVEWECWKGIDSAYWEAKITLDGYYTATQVANYKDLILEAPDYLGTLHTVFYGFVPDFGVIQNSPDKTTTVHAYSHDWYLSNQFIDEINRGTATYIPWGMTGYMDFLEPSVVVTAILGGVANWNAVSGVKPLYIIAPTAWGSSSLPKRGWAWKPNTTPYSAIMDLCDYLSYMFDAVYDGTYQGGRFCHIDDIDTYMGAPASVTFTNTDSPLFVISVSGDTRGRDKINRIRVQGNRNTRIVHFDAGMVEFVPGNTVIDGGTGAEATIISCTTTPGTTWGVDATGYLIISYDRTGRFIDDNTLQDELGGGLGLATIDGYDEPYELFDVYNYEYPETAPVRPREHFEQLGIEFDSTPLIQGRAVELYDFLSTDATPYTVVVHDRPDLKLWQIIKVIGYDGIPEVDMRVVHIRHKYSNATNLITTLTLNVASYVTAQRKIRRTQVDQDYQAVKDMVQEIMEQYVRVDEGTALAVVGDYVLIQMDDGEIKVTAKKP